MEDATLINGLLAKRAELVNLNAELRECIAVVANDIEGSRDSLGYRLPVWFWASRRSTRFRRLHVAAEIGAVDFHGAS